MNLGNSAQSYIGLRGHTDFLEQFCIAKQNNQLHHAYLFFGKLGIGKSLLARQLAAYLLQEEKENTPVFNGMEQNEVKNILSLNENNSVWRQVFYHSHPDLIYLFAHKSETNKSGQIKIEDIKSIAHLTHHQSGRGGWRIVIIDSLDNTNRNSSNAILKILEEPPEKTIFFLISHKINNVIPTIRSRCQQVRLKPLSDSDALAILQSHMEDQEGSNLKQLIWLAEGSPGMALLIANAKIEIIIDTLADIFLKNNFEFQKFSSLMAKWGADISKMPEMAEATAFLIDKLFSQAALSAVAALSIADDKNIKNKENDFDHISLLTLAEYLAEKHTAEELAKFHIEWQIGLQQAEQSYLDMGVFMQQIFYKIYSQTQTP
ncbi:AAA family ATPase [Alphaproteobacteria bacterium]|nr:AAA family ATPase [Alphaproteobacteria bacterium]